MLRGNHPAKIDEKGRLKIPNAFKALVEQHHGTALYVTSLRGESVWIYPLPAWIEYEQRLSRLGNTDPSLRRFIDRVSYHGQTTEFDAQGRVVIPPRLRVLAGIDGDVDVLGRINHLEVWNHERLVARMESDPYSEEDDRRLAQVSGVQGGG